MEMQRMREGAVVGVYHCDLNVITSRDADGWSWKGVVEHPCIEQNRLISARLLSLNLFSEPKDICRDYNWFAASIIIICNQCEFTNSCSIWKNVHITTCEMCQICLVICRGMLIRRAILELIIGLHGR